MVDKATTEISADTDFTTTRLEKEPSIIQFGRFEQVLKKGSIVALVRTPGFVSVHYQ